MASGKVCNSVTWSLHRTIHRTQGCRVVLLSVGAYFVLGKTKNSLHKQRHIWYTWPSCKKVRCLITSISFNSSTWRRVSYPKSWHLALPILSRDFRFHNALDLARSEPILCNLLNSHRYTQCSQILFKVFFTSMIIIFFWNEIN